VGADGIHSVVRTSLFGAIKPRFSNQICWRVVLPMEAIRRAAPGLPVPLTGMEYTGWLGPTGHVLFYPLRGGELLNIFAGRVSTQWVGESWTVESSLPAMLEAYSGWNQGMLDVLSQAQSAYCWGIHDRDPMASWTTGRITLLGDAAHPMMPTLAQGAAISMEDGMALARHLDGPDIDAALAAYESERRPRASQVQLQARQQFLNNQLTPPPPPLPTDWIYGHDAVTGAHIWPPKNDMEI
jgi:salicylate hydroxylase